MSAIKEFLHENIIISMTIQEWLDDPNRDFQKGVELYMRYGKNANLLRRFKKQDEYTTAKLPYELAKLVEEQLTIPAPPEDAPAAKPIEGDTRFIGEYAKGQAPTREHPIEVKNKIVERARLSNSLWDYAPEDNAGRQPVVQRIKELTKEITAALYPQDAKAAKPGKPEQTATAEPTSPMEAVKTKANAMTSVSKWKRKLAEANPDSEAFTKATERLQELNNLIAKCDQIIHAATTETKPTE